MKEAVQNYYLNSNHGGKTYPVKLTTITVVQKLLEDVNPAKSEGLDNLTGKFLKGGASILATLITDMYNLSISLSAFPDDCKIAKLKPIYEKDSKIKPKNYGPNSLLPFIEKIIHCQPNTIIFR